MNIMQNNVQQLTEAEVEQVSGGVIFAPILYSCFVSGAKWGAGIALATYAISTRDE